MIIRLPLPPSANHHWRMFLLGKSPRMLLSADGRKYRTDVAAAWLAEGNSKIEGRLRISILICYRDRRKIDLDNRCKPLLDALASCGAFDNDDQIDELHVLRGPVSPPDGYVDVEIETMEAS